MLVIALTGGIGSGKSSVAERLAWHGVPVIDADAIAHELTAPGGAAINAITRAFGAGVVAADGGLDRSAMRRIVFADPKDRLRLEAILHPSILDRMRKRLATVEGPYAVLVVPLLFETGQKALGDRVLVVDIPVDEQVRRVQARNGLSRREIERILATQVSRQVRLDGADDVIDNSGDPATLRDRVDELHRRYLAIAAECGA